MNTTSDQITVTQSDLERAAKLVSCEESLNESNRCDREGYVLAVGLLASIVGLYGHLSKQPGRIILGAGGYIDTVSKIGDAKVHLAGLGIEVSVDSTPHDNQQLPRNSLLESMVPILADAHTLFLLVDASISGDRGIPTLALRNYGNKVEAALNGLLFNLLTTPYVAAVEAKTRILTEELV